MLDALLPYIVMLPAGYLLGSLPFGLILGKLSKGVDVRDYGSGSTGMTNVMRTAGAPAAALTLLLDMCKAVVAVLIARWLFDAPGAEALAGALAALAGHNWPVFVGFRGGKGTAAGWGALIILSPISGLVATLVGVPTVALTRYVSLGSILGTLSGVITLTSPDSPGTRALGIPVFRRSGRLHSRGLAQTQHPAPHQGGRAQDRQAVGSRGWVRGDGLCQKSAS